MALGHERLDVYRLAIAYVAWVYEKSATLEGVHRAARDQWLRASQSIPLNIAEGNGKTADADRRRYFDIARGSALECAAIQDVLVVGKALDAAESQNRKTELDRMAAMLSRLGGRVYQVRKSEEAYTTGEEEVDPDPDSDSDLDETKPQQGGGGAAMRSPHHRASPPNPFVPTASCPLPTGAQAPSHHAPFGLPSPDPIHPPALDPEYLDAAVLRLPLPVVRHVLSVELSLNPEPCPLNPLLRATAPLRETFPLTPAPCSCSSW